jgi:membrane protein
MAKLLNTTKDLARLTKETFNQWNEREPFNNSIIISYYTIFSLPGLLVIIINISSYFFEREVVTSSISTQIQGIVGGNTAEDIEEIIENASQSQGTALASILSIATLLFGATGVFYQLQQILNKMWEVKPKPKGKFLKLIKDRVFSFGLILVVGFLLLVSLVISAGLTSLTDWASAYIPEALLVVFNVLDIIISIGVITVLFAAIYKFLPDAKIKWRDVWIGAALTSVLFTVAKFLLGLYFGNSDPGSTYGAAGSIILIMLWVSYAGLILLFGAEFTQVYAAHHGRKIMPTEGAVSTEGENENGAIVNKKTEKESKAKAEAKTKEEERAESKSFRRSAGSKKMRRKEENTGKTDSGFLSKIFKTE